MIFRKTLLVLAVSAATLAGTQTAQAATYSDRASFAAAAGMSTTITFEGLLGNNNPAYAEYTTGGYATQHGYTLSGVEFRGVSPYYYSYIWDFGRASPGYILNGSDGGMFDQYGGRFILPADVSAFGLDYGNTSGAAASVQLVIHLANGTSQSFDRPISGGVGFFGFTGGEVSSVDIVDAANQSTYIKYDDVTIGRAGAVPEPATWALLILGFGLVGTMVRRAGRQRELLSVVAA